MKKILVVSEGVPHIYHGGGGITIYSAILSLLSSGFQVKVLCIPSQIDASRNSDQKKIDDLKKHGAEVDFFKNKNFLKPINRSKLARIFTSRLSDVFPTVLLTEEVRKNAIEYGADAILAYHWESCAAICNVNEIPKLALVGDPADLAFKFRKESYLRNGLSRFSYEYLKLKWQEFVRIRPMEKYMLEILNKCEVSGAFAAHHANEFKMHGVKNCRYFHTPVPPTTRRSVVDISRKKFKILHIGHLLGVATISGLELMMSEVVPELVNILGSQNFSIHIVGGNYETLPPRIQQMLQHPNVILRGHITPADEEFLSSDIIFVPIPIELGIRVRIITAMSFGCCVVTHVANEKGIPELKNGNNAMLGKNGKELAQQIVALLGNSSEREKLMDGAYGTYEQFFSIKSVGEEIKSALLTAMDVGR